MTAAYEVFLSHNSRDRALVRQVASALKARGVTAWLDEEALIPGRRWKREIQDALTAARSIAVLIGSEGYGPWHEMEADVYLGRAVKEEKPFIPVLLPGAPAAGELTGFLAEFTAVDLRAGLSPEGIDRLIRGIRGAEVKRSDGLWTVPHPRNPHFTGREAVLAELHARLTSTGRAALSQAITGLGGVGKTQTAAEYCHRHRDAYRHVLWIDAESASALAEGYGDLARRLGLVAEAEADPGKIRGAVIGWLEHQEGWLLVLDNVDSVEDLRPYLPTGGRGRVLITTRNSTLPGLGVDRPVDLEVMAPGESVAFLLERTGAGELGREAAEALAAELGHLPLALEQAAAYIAEVGVSLSAYLDSWKKRRLALLEKQGPQEGRYKATVATTWAVSFERVEAASRASADVLRVAAFLAPDAIPEELFAEAAEHLGPALAVKAGELNDELEIAELLAPLARISLIRRRPAERTFAVHRMVQEAVRTALGDERNEWLGRAVAGLNALAPFEVTSPTEWPRYRRITLHAQALAGHLAESEADPAPAGRLLSQTAHFLWTQGRHADAKALQEQALDLARRGLGAEHPDTLTSMNNLALTLGDQGDLAGARDLHERSLSVRRRVLGEEHPDTLTSMNNLAMTLWAQGDLAGARDLHERSLAVLRRVLGEEHPNTLSSMNNLAETLGAQGDLAGARDLHERSLAVCRRVLGEEHPDTLTSMNNLAETLRAQGDLAGARDLHERSLSVLRRVLGEEHPNTLSSMNNLALTLGAQGDLAGARDLHEQELAVCRRVLGEEHPDTLRSMNNLGLTLAGLGELRAGHVLLREAVEGIRRVLGEEHPSTKLYAENLAHVEARLAAAPSEPEPSS